MIYFLQSIDGGPVKIGFTDNLEVRRQQLEAHYGCPLALLATAAGGRDEERAWHERFAHLRFGRTEQFRPAPELMAAIGRPLLVGVNPDAVEAMPVAAEGTPKPRTVGVRATGEWAEWLDRAARHFRTTNAGLIDRALAEWTTERGFSEAPPERVP